MNFAIKHTLEPPLFGLKCLCPYSVQSNCTQHIPHCNSFAQYSSCLNVSLFACIFNSKSTTIVFSLSGLWYSLHFTSSSISIILNFSHYYFQSALQYPFTHRSARNCSVTKTTRTIFRQVYSRVGILYGTEDVNVIKTSLSPQWWSGRWTTAHTYFAPYAVADFAVWWKMQYSLWHRSTARQCVLKCIMSASFAHLQPFGSNLKVDFSNPLVWEELGRGGLRTGHFDNPLRVPISPQLTREPGGRGGDRPHSSEPGGGDAPRSWVTVSALTY